MSAQRTWYAKEEAPRSVLTGVGVVEVRFVATNDLTHTISVGSALERYSVSIKPLLLTR